ncbi:hypothetical protein LSAT2_024006 [Lamellibrachia satsuma]|nr:hypothetical protein LSAT2_024006 [Lamellibrachia satsuma]
MSGFLGSLKKGLTDAGRTITKEADKAAQSIQHAVDGTRSSPILDLFKSGNVIQLISRSSGKCLEIVKAPTGRLIIDGLGPEGPAALHTHWTVLNEGNNIIKLYSGNNYLAIVDGLTQILSVANPAFGRCRNNLPSQPDRAVRHPGSPQGGRSTRGHLTDGRTKVCPGYRPGTTCPLRRETHSLAIPPCWGSACRSGGRTSTLFAIPSA